MKISGVLKSLSERFGNSQDERVIKARIADVISVLGDYDIEVATPSSYGPTGAGREVPGRGAFDPWTGAPWRDDPLGVNAAPARIAGVWGELLEAEAARLREEIVGQTEASALRLAQARAAQSVEDANHALRVANRLGDQILTSAEMEQAYARVREMGRNPIETPRPAEVTSYAAAPWPEPIGRSYATENAAAAVDYAERTSIRPYEIELTDQTVDQLVDRALAAMSDGHTYLKLTRDGRAHMIYLVAADRQAILESLSRAMTELRFPSLR